MQRRRRESETGVKAVGSEGRTKERTKEQEVSGVGKKEEGDRRGRRRMWDGGGEGVQAQATPPATGSRSLHSIDDDVLPTSSRTPPTSQHSTRQLSQSCRERNPQRETILSTRNAASSTHFAVGSCVSRDDMSPETFPSPVTRRLHPRFHPIKDIRHLIPVSQHQHSMETTPGASLWSFEAATLDRPTARNRPIVVCWVMRRMHTQAIQKSERAERARHGRRLRRL